MIRTTMNAPHHFPSVRILLFSLFLLLATISTSQQMPARATATPSANQGEPILNLDGLQRGFLTPPDNSKIMMRWWWFGPAVTKPQLEREIRSMKSAGIGGFELQAVYPVALEDPEAGIVNLPYLSDGFLDALRFANDKAYELGMRADLTLGSGWPYGGPQVSIADAAGRLRYEHVKLTTTSTSMPIPDSNRGEKLLAVFLARIQGQSIDPGSLREITDIADGVAHLPSDTEGATDVLFFFSSRTGMMVKRPAVGAEGFVLNHYDRQAVENYQKNVADRLMQAFQQHPPHSVFCDSLEVYQSDWTPDFMEEFKKRRGYDLKPLLPALVSDFGSKTESVRQDWGMTLTELFNERFAAPMREWAHRNNTLFRMQGYGIPPATISSNALSDLPEGEGPQWKVLRASRWASSASHLYGRTVTSSETWTWVHSPVFRATPLDLKAEAHLHFLQGINQLIGHGWPYTAEGVQYPGWRFYASGALNDKNPWWIVMPDLALYLQRLSFLLRQGQPANDVAFYLPNNDGWAHFSPGHVNMIDALGERIGPDAVARVLDSGFNLDFVDDGVVNQLAHVEKGALVVGANKYKVVVLPNVERIPLSTLKKLEEFVHNGGILIAMSRTPSIDSESATPEGAQQIADITRGLFEGASAPGHLVKDEEGKDQFQRKLTSLLSPDVAISPAAPEIGFVHRRTGDAEVYFLANTSNRSQSVKATFRVQGLHPEWWDPTTGRVSPADVVAKTAGNTAAKTNDGTTVTLDIEPYASRVLVFTARTLPPPARRKAIASLPTPLDISTAWQVSFGTQQPVAMERLHSWTDEEQTRYFSGEATYEKSVTLPQSLFRPGLALTLDFGEGKPLPSQPLKAGMQAWLDAPIREAAVVYVNDQRAGSIWSPPYSLNVNQFLHPGENKIRVVVANLAINYMAGRALPDYKLLNLRYGVRFEAQDLDKVQVVPSGLLGPIRLVSH